MRPTAYPTMILSNGARHVIVPGLQLGAAIDGEPNGQPTAAGAGRRPEPVPGPDDEDGVSFYPLIPGQTARST